MPHTKLHDVHLWGKLPNIYATCEAVSISDVDRITVHMTVMTIQDNADTTA